MTVLIRKQAAPQLLNKKWMGIVRQGLQELKPKLRNTVVQCVANCSLIHEILKDMLGLIQERTLTSVLCVPNLLLNHAV